MSIIARLALAGITVRAALTAEGWRWLPLEAISPNVEIVSSGTGFTLPHNGWWEIRITTPQSTSVSQGGTTVTVPAGTTFLHRQVTSGRTVMVGATVAAENVGKEIFATARPL